MLESSSTIAKGNLLMSEKTWHFLSKSDHIAQTIVNKGKKTMFLSLVTIKGETKRLHKVNVGLQGTQHTSGCQKWHSAFIL